MRSVPPMDRDWLTALGQKLHWLTRIRVPGLEPGNYQATYLEPRRTYQDKFWS